MRDNIVFVALFITHGTFSLIQSSHNDCANFTGTRPFIWPLGEAREEYLALGDHRRSSVKEFLGTSIDFVYHRNQFNCTHDRPIHWVFHLNPEETETTTAVDFAQRIRSKGAEGGVRYNYSANFRLVYLPRDLRHGMLFSCEPVQLMNQCERNFIQAINTRLLNKPVAIPDNTLSSLAVALLKSSTERIAPQFSNRKECPFRLVIQMEKGNVIRFKWKLRSGTPGTNMETSYSQTNESSYLSNVYRLNAKSRDSERNCVQVLKESTLCEDCELVQKFGNYTTNAVAFQATNGETNVTMIYKGMFSVPKGDRSERIFYFDWQLSNEVIQKEMMQLEIPSEVYANIPVVVKCRVSVFVFAFGTVISGQNSSDLDEDQSTEVFSEYGYREVLRSLVFNADNASQRKGITCFAPLRNSEDWVSRKATVFVDIAMMPSIDDSPENLTESRTISPNMYPVFLECNCSGNPLPSLRWITPGKNNLSSKLEHIKFNDSIRLEFPKWETDFAGTYVCEARNFLGITTKTITLLNENEIMEGGSNKIVIIVFSTLGAIMSILGGAIWFLAWKIRKQRREFEKQTQRAVEEFKNGLVVDDTKEGDEHDINFNVLQLPYNENFEVTRNDWEVEGKVLGSGQFGIVRMGVVNVQGKKIKVAVKTLKSTVEIDDFKSFLFELKIMAYIGQHRNIVSLIAACSEGINDREILIGVEYCDNGCLLEYMRKHRATFQNMVTPNGKVVSDVSTVDWGTLYVNISKISTHDIYRWSYHIACGMDYLSVRKVLHGDLAARNVLLTSRKVAKVSDFGLSRVLMNSENYTKQSQTPLPWKWMAIESLKSRIFSTHSDTWSYGITLYELFTVGQIPYPGVSWSPDFITQLENGMRMERPVHCTVSIYKIMRACWEHEPNNRPNYAKIKRKFSKGLRRLSVLIAAQKQQQENQQLSAESRTQSTSIPPVPEIAVLLEQDEGNEQIEGGVYANLQRRTMNYYKNF